jgi:alkylated DNA repair dioxygenase AlkB
MTKEQSDKLFRNLRSQVEWKQEKIKIMGKDAFPSRMTASYGNKGLIYKYSGVQKESTEWIEPLITIKELIEKETGVSYNYALLNLYR